MHLLFVTTLGIIERNFLQSSLILPKLGSSNVSQKFFLVEICRSFGITSKELVLKNHFSEHHTADKDHTEIL